MRRDPEYFGDEELPLLYVAKRLKEALRVEEVLTQAGIDYLVEPDRYSGGIIFRTERVGAFFYSSNEQAKSARRAMNDAGFKPYSDER